MTLGDILDLTQDEITYWKAYELTYGLPFTRLEWSIAIGSTATANSMGAKLKASDLIPRIEQPITDVATARAFLASRFGIAD
jgi:hypothetical protein